MSTPESAALAERDQIAEALGRVLKAATWLGDAEDAKAARVVQSWAAALHPQPVAATQPSGDDGPAELWLAPACCADPEGRQWCEDGGFDPCACKPPSEPVRYVRADLAATQLSEREKALEAVIQAVQYTGSYAFVTENSGGSLKPHAMFVFSNVEQMQAFMDAIRALKGALPAPREAGKP